METIKSNLNKALRFALMFFIMAAVATTFTACGDDDDEPGIDGDLIGTWTYTGPYEDTYETCTLTFKKDGTLVIHEEFSDDPEAYTSYLEYSVVGNISSNATLRMWGQDIEGEPIDYTFLATLSGNKLTLIGLIGEVWEDGITFTRN